MSISCSWGPTALPVCPGCFTTPWPLPLYFRMKPPHLSVAEVRQHNESNISKACPKLYKKCRHVVDTQRRGPSSLALLDEGSGSLMQFARHRKGGVGTVGHRERPPGAGLRFPAQTKEERRAVACSWPRPPPCTLQLLLRNLRIDSWTCLQGQIELVQKPGHEERNPYRVLPVYVSGRERNFSFKYLLKIADKYLLRYNSINTNKADCTHFQRALIS